MKKTVEVEVKLTEAERLAELIRAAKAELRDDPDVQFLIHVHVCAPQAPDEQGGAG